jgi:hypothetical protein
LEATVVPTFRPLPDPADWEPCLICGDHYPPRDPADDGLDTADLCPVHAFPEVARAVRLAGLSYALCAAPNLTPALADVMVRLDAEALPVLTRYQIHRPC